MKLSEENLKLVKLEVFRWSSHLRSYKPLLLLHAQEEEEKEREKIILIFQRRKSQILDSSFYNL